MDPVRELLVWLCKSCHSFNTTAIPTHMDYKFVCHSCSELAGLGSLGGATWHLDRSAECDECNTHSVVFAGSVMPCPFCQWTEKELAFEPGTTVLFVPRQAKNNPYHSSVESGVVVKHAIRLDCVFVCYAAKDGMEGRAKLTKKTDLYLHRWATPEWAQDFLKSREEA